MKTFKETKEILGISNQTFYNYKKQLNLNPYKDKRGRLFFEDNEIELMQNFKDYLKNGGDISEFKYDDIPMKMDAITEPKQDFMITIEQPEAKLISEDLIDILKQITKLSPIDKLKQLKEIAELNILLDTASLKYLIGVKPSEGMRRGSFSFMAKGKIGNQKAWLVRFHDVN